jgi:hypothetical protein
MGGSGEGGNTAIGGMNPVVNDIRRRKRERRRRREEPGSQRKSILLKIQGWQPPSSQSGWRTI